MKAPLKEAAIEVLLAAGFVPNGETASQTVRVPTSRSPVLNHGKSGGEVTTFGGRARFAKPGTDRRATVGERTVCFYRTVNGSAQISASFETKDLEAIRARAAQ